MGIVAGNTADLDAGEFLAAGDLSVVRRCRVRFAPDANGSATIVVRAMDEGAQSALDTFVVTVTAVNDTPVVASAIPDTTVSVSNPPIDNYRSLLSVFNDAEEGDALTYSIESNSNPGLVTVIIDGDSALDLSFTPLLQGSATMSSKTPAIDSNAWFAHRSETMLSVALLGVLVVLLIPLPPVLLDMLLAFSCEYPWSAENRHNGRAPFCVDMLQVEHREFDAKPCAMP